MRIDTNIGAVEYIGLVEQIADGFIATDGSYIPHAGRLNAMEIFYTRFYNHNAEDLHGLENLSILDDIFGNTEFIAAYNDALKGDGLYQLDFSNAYADAMQIVDDRHNSITRGANLVGKIVEKYFKPDNLAQIFGGSKRFQEIIDSDPDNVVSFIEQLLRKE